MALRQCSGVGRSDPRGRTGCEVKSAAHPPYIAGWLRGASGKRSTSDDVKYLLGFDDGAAALRRAVEHSEAVDPQPVDPDGATPDPKGTTSVRTSLEMFQRIQQGKARQ